MPPAGPGPIPADLIAAARRHGEEVVQLVLEAHERGREQGRASGAQQMRLTAVAACAAEAARLSEGLVELDAKGIVELEGRFEEMSPSPLVAAYYDGGSEAAEACAARVRALSIEDDAPTH